MSLSRLIALLAALATLLTLATNTALASVPKTSLTAIEPDVMCVSCREPLAVAQSPQSYAERNFIRALIAQGEDKKQIEQALVAQYGPAVLGRPPAHGFNLTVYILPPALLVLGLAILAFTLPKWRRRSRARTTAHDAKRLDPAANQRLDQELARFDG